MTLAWSRVGWLIGLVILGLGIVACDAPAPANPTAQKLRAEVLGLLDKLGPLLASAVARGDHAAADRVLADFFLAAAREGTPLTRSVVVLDKSGRFFAGRYPHQGRPEGEPEQEWLGQDYSRFASIKDGMNKGRPFTAVLHSTGRRWFAAGRPLSHEDKPVGAVGVILPSEALDGPPPLSETEFLALDLRP